MARYKRSIFLGMILISLGITLTSTLGADLGSVGIVLIGVGGFFIIAGIRLKNKG